MSETTEAAVLFELGAPLRLVELELPAPRPGQLLVDVAYSGICHTQLLEARGKRGPDRFLPHTLGHEGSGVVADVGSGVTKVRPGDGVVLSWLKGSGLDVASTVYRSDAGPVNSGAISTFMRRTITCENRVTPVPAALSLRAAALLGCAIPTGFGIVFNTARVEPGATVAVYGLGGIGLSAVLGARLAGASRIIAVDVVEAKLAAAIELGATDGVDASRTDVRAAIQELTEGRGVDCAIEAAGRRESMESAFRSTRYNGGMCVLAGNLPAGQTIAIDPMDLIRGRRILGTWGGETVPDRDIPRYARLCLSGALELEKLISHEYPLADVNVGLDELESGRLTRGVLRMTSAT
ncbi:MAG: zinc-binding dehydrogenase [Gemmatimonadetes bacterium]|nr:zinc-binding dehydrogenase [Gemmatimonadota bacterium]